MKSTKRIAIAVLGLGLCLSACQVEAEYDASLDDDPRQIGECSTTPQCKSLYGNEATDCRNDLGGLCYCDDVACADGGGGSQGECSTTPQCKSLYGNEATDCRNDLGGICYCDNVTCADGGGGPPGGGELVWSRNFNGESAGSHPWDELATVKNNCGPDGSRCLEVAYQPTNNGTSRVTGKTSLPPANEYSLNYDVRFSGDFQFVKGGKLHGLGPSKPITGCKPMKNDGWSARVMWDKSNSSSSRPFNYLYHQSKTENCGDGDKSSSGAKFTRGQWHAVTLHVKVNSEGSKSNGFTHLYIDGEKIVESNGIRFRKSSGSAGKIANFMFSTFHGGSNDSWSPSKKVTARFDNFAVYKGKRVRNQPGQ